MKHLFFMIATLIMTFNVYAHNENKYGPHNGYIRMPGVFHTEVVPEKNQNFRIYLLDVNIKNPSTQNSTVALRYEGDKGFSAQYKCLKEKEYFSCSIDSNTTTLDLRSGSLVVEASREGKKGTPARYPLPLSLNMGMSH